MGIEGKKEISQSEKERLTQEYREAKEFFQKSFGELFLDFCEYGRQKPSSGPEEVEGLAEQFFNWMDEKRDRLTKLREELMPSDAKSIDYEFEGRKISGLN